MVWSLAKEIKALWSNYSSVETFTGTEFEALCLSPAST